MPSTVQNRLGGSRKPKDGYSGKDLAPDLSEFMADFVAEQLEVTERCHNLRNCDNAIALLNGYIELRKCI